MPHVFNRCVSSVGLRICLITAAFFGIIRAGAQERATPDSNRSRTPTLPPSLLDSMRNRTNPFQPQKLQSLLIKPEVQAELEIDRNTYSMVSSALKELNEKQMEVSKGFMNMNRTDQETTRKHLEQFNALQVERDRATEEALNEVFRPEKFKRVTSGNVFLHRSPSENVAIPKCQEQSRRGTSSFFVCAGFREKESGDKSPHSKVARQS